MFLVYQGDIVLSPCPRYPVFFISLMAKKIRKKREIKAGITLCAAVKDVGGKGKTVIAGIHSRNRLLSSKKRCEWQRKEEIILKS